MIRMAPFWLIPVKWKSWKISHDSGLFGVRQGNKNELDQINIGDFLVFYILPPTKGIVSICEVISNPFFDTDPLSNKLTSINYKYNYRVRIKLNEKLILNKEQIIPLYEIMGYEDDDKEYVIEPYLGRVIKIKMSDKQINSLLSIFKSIKKN